MKSIIKVMILMLFVILVAFGGVYVLKFFGVNGGPLTQVVPFLTMVLGATIFLKIIDKKKWSDIGLHQFTTTIDSSVILLVIATTPIVFGIINDHGVHMTKPISASVLLSIGYCFVIGFSEELLYRGYIYNTITINKLKVVISALAFSGFHFISPEFNVFFFILYFIFGVTKAYLFRIIKSLWPLIIFHMIWDLGTTYTEYYTNPIIDLLTLGIALIVIGLVKRAKDRSGNQNEENNSINVH